MTFMAAVAVGWTLAALTALVCGLRIPMPRPLWHQSGLSRRGVWLQQAGVPASYGQFVASIIGLFAVSWIVLGAMSGGVVAIVPSAAIAAVPVLYYSRRRTTRLAQAQQSWPDALRDVVTSVASGQSLHQALCSLSNGHHGPLSAAFQRYPSLSRSIGSVAALEMVRAELADPVSDRVIEVFVLAVERGGSVVRVVLDDLTQSIGADVRVLNEIDTALLESRINARAVVVLPWVALLLLNQGGGPFRDFYSSSGGAVVVFVGAVLTVVGWGAVSRLSRIPNEERVFVPRGQS